MEKKYQIFISSTYKDLIPERNAVRDTILSMHHFPIGMEMFSAADEEQWEIIQEAIDSTDYYIIIIGKRYGSVIPDGKPEAGMSYTEKEYRYALSHAIPVLAFIKKDSYVTADNVEVDPKSAEKLKAFTDDIISSREVEWFEDDKDLSSKVSIALYKQFNRRKRPGWVRGDRFDIDASFNELVVLNRRVRELEEENNRLRLSAEKRIPKLSVSLQFAGTVEEPINLDEEHDDQSFEAEENIIDVDVDCTELGIAETVRRQPVNRQYLTYLEPLSIEDVPEDLRAYVTSDAIDDYNHSLPNRDVIDKYNKEMWYYNEVHKNGQLLNFIIVNEGTAKASDINITMEFPDSVMVIKRDKAQSISEPKEPNMPHNPIEEAQMRKYSGSLYGNMHKRLVNLMPNPYRYLPANDLLNIDPLILNDYSANWSWSVDIKGQTVNIWSRDLLHTYTQTVDELCIIPLKKGIFKIKVHMMCEEYIEPAESELELRVE